MKAFVIGVHSILFIWHLKKPLANVYLSFQTALQISLEEQITE